jgi:hypothetical protein
VIAMKCKRKYVVETVRFTWNVIMYMIVYDNIICKIIR